MEGGPGYDLAIRAGKTELDCLGIFTPTIAALSFIAASGAGQDRAVALPTPDGLLIAVADGAGGMGGAAAAANQLIAFVSSYKNPTSSSDWCSALLRFDQRLSVHACGGQTTGIVAYADRNHIRGASVGDSSAWLVSVTSTLDLTADQHRKPLLGSGSAMPISFAAALGDRRVLIGTDGLFKYAPAERIRALATSDPLQSAADRLANSVRLSSGAVHDDIAVVLVANDPAG